jgi:hypothetical protein
MTRQSNLNGCLWRIFVRRTAGSRIVLAMTGQSANWNRPQTPAVQWSNSAKKLQNFMKICFYAVTGYPGARSHFLGRLACIAFVSGSTISLSFAGFRDGGVRFSALDLLRLTAMLMLITRTSAGIAAEPWDILSTAVRSLPRTVRR